MSKKFFALAAFMCCFSMGLAAKAELVSYWPFEELVDDFSTPDVVSGYDMEVVGDFFSSDNHIEGRVGKAFEFFNADQTMLSRIHDEGDLLPINQHAEFTISMWAKVEGTGQNDLRLLSEGNSTGNNDPLFNIGTANNGADGTLDTYIRNNALSTPTVNHPHTTAEPFNGEWSHIGWTFKDGVHSIYIDGAFDSSNEMESFGVVDPLNIDNTSIGGIQRGAASHWVTGAIDEVAMWNEVIPPNALVGLAQGKTTPLEALDFTEVLLPQLSIDGNLGLAGEVTNVVKSEPKETSGLAQYWYDANLRAQPEAFLEAGDEGSEAAPLVAEPFASSTTWWAGPQNQNIVTDLELPRYPDGLAGTRFDGSAGENNYAVRLTGEIFIEENGEYLIRDGIDDFTMIALDQDGNGELDDLENIVAADVGFPFPGDPIGDVLVLDDDWANINGASQLESSHGIADIEGIAAGGEWRKFELWMSEGGGGDAGIVYMGNLDDDDIFDETVGDALSQEQIDKFVIRNDQLRSVVSVIESADSAAALRDDVEYVLDVSADGNEAISINDGNGLYNTTLDVSDATIRIAADGDIEDGATFTIFDADTIAGVDSVTINFDDASQWDLSNLASGQITFGTAVSLCDPNSGGDLNGDGSVGFPDFLILSANFGTDATSHTVGDINCDGSVGFPDFLVLSANFGNAVGAQATSAVPEPSGLALFGIAALFSGLVRRRR